jgi:hypothetical protein
VVAELSTRSGGSCHGGDGEVMRWSKWVEGEEVEMWC